MTMTLRFGKLSIACFDFNADEIGNENGHFGRPIPIYWT
jgi:hypothetical protein